MVFLLRRLRWLGWLRWLRWLGRADRIKVGVSGGVGSGARSGSGISSGERSRSRCIGFQGEGSGYLTGSQSLDQ
jgi:hypothetical protein